MTAQHGLMYGFHFTEQLCFVMFCCTVCVLCGWSLPSDSVIELKIDGSSELIVLSLDDMKSSDKTIA